MTNTTQNGSQAFLVYLQSPATEGAVMSLINQSVHRVQVPGVPNAQIVFSNANLTDWYQGVNATDTNAPIILPIDIGAMRSLTGNLPSFLQGFLNHQSVRAA